MDTSYPRKPVPFGGRVSTTQTIDSRLRGSDSFCKQYEYF